MYAMLVSIPQAVGTVATFEKVVATDERTACKFQYRKR